MRRGIVTRGIATAIAAAIVLTCTGTSTYASPKTAYEDEYEISAEYEECDYSSEEQTIVDGTQYTVLTDENGNPYDLGGMEIIIRDWFSPDPPPAPANDYEKAFEEHKKWAEETYNFKIKNVPMDDWGDVLENFEEYVQAGGDSKNYLFTLNNSETDKVFEFMQKGYFYDLSTLDCLDFTKRQYSLNRVAESYGLYAMKAGASEPRSGLIFNETLLARTGVNVDDIYAKQKNGTWTWDAFEDVLQKVQDYSDAHPSEEIEAFDCNECVLVTVGVESNTGYGVVKKTDDGFSFGLSDSAALEALAWEKDIMTRFTPPSEGAWDQYQKDFRAGKLAFVADNLYCITSRNVFSKKYVNDKVGFVAFPKGPKMQTYVNAVSDNIYAIPSCYSKERAWKIAFAYDVINEPLKGFDYIDQYTKSYTGTLSDERIVSDTIPIMCNSVSALQTFADSFAGNINQSFLYKFYPSMPYDVADLVNDIKDGCNEKIADVNKAVFNRYKYNVVNFDNNGHGQAINTRYVYTGTNNSFRNAFATGYIFKGWYTDKACTKQFDGVVNRNMTLYAKWEVCKHPQVISKTTKATLKKDGKVVETCTKCKAVAKNKTIPRAYISAPDSEKYTGKDIKPIKIVTATGKTIDKKNYTITYKNNKNVGTATAKITFKKDYSGSASVKFTIVKKDVIPDKVTGLKLTAGKKCFTAKWKPLTDKVVGYEIQYSNDSKFLNEVKSATLSKRTASSKKISKLTKGKTFYVRIRAYNKDGNKKAYSAWSASKKVKIK